MNADAAMRAGFDLLLAGRMNEGFRLYDRQRELPHRAASMAPELPFQLWRGQDIGGARILIWSEEGYGDQIMYARFARRLAEMGGEVTWLCPPELARLFRECLGVNAIAADHRVELSGFDFYCPSSALPLGFDLDGAGIPAAPYLKRPPPAVIAGLTMGIVADCNPKNINAANKRLDATNAGRLLGLPGAVNLDPAETGARDFHDTARIMAGLELVISVDTAAAHLAGAVGVPVWVLVPAKGADWRWLRGRDDSPWYASARLYRQAADSWDATIERLIEDFHALRASADDAGLVGAREDGS